MSRYACRFQIFKMGAIAMEAENIFSRQQMYAVLK
jgi:hypothetical protein